MKNTTYEQMGIAALLPGLTFALELIQQRVDELRDQIAGLIEPPKKRGRPKKAAPAPVKQKQGWSDDPEERRREMARRVAKRKHGKKSLGMNRRSA